jgi:hypothetical protein
MCLIIFFPLQNSMHIFEIGFSIYLMVYKRASCCIYFKCIMYFQSTCNLSCVLTENTLCTYLMVICSMVKAFMVNNLKMIVGKFSV